MSIPTLKDDRASTASGIARPGLSRPGIIMGEVSARAGFGPTGGAAAGLDVGTTVAVVAPDPGRARRGRPTYCFGEAVTLTSFLVGLVFAGVRLRKLRPG